MNGPLNYYRTALVRHEEELGMYSLPLSISLSFLAFYFLTFFANK